MAQGRGTNTPVPPATSIAGKLAGQAAWRVALNRLGSETMNHWFAHRASSKGAALAFYALFSMLPIMLLAIGITGYFFGLEPARSEIATQLRAQIGPSGTQAILGLLKIGGNQASGWLATIVAGALLLFGTTSLFTELKGSLDDLWGSDKRRSPALLEFFKTRLLSFVLVLFLAFLLLVSILVSAAQAILADYLNAAWSSSAVLIATSSTICISFAITVCLFAIIYKTLPDAPLSWHDVWIGACLTACLFSLGKYLIGLYLIQSTVASGFGPAGSVVAVLLWVYYSAQIFLLGAIFTRQYAIHFGSLKGS